MVTSVGVFESLGSTETPQAWCEPLAGMTYKLWSTHLLYAIVSGKLGVSLGVWGVESQHRIKEVATPLPESVH